LNGVTGARGTLSGISQRNGCCAVNFLSTQPSLNYGFANVKASWQHSVDSKAAIATRDEMLKIIRFWLGLGCDGFRVDMANDMIKNDPDKSETIKFWQKVLADIQKDYPDAAFVSEWGEPDKALLAGFDMDFLLHFGPSHYMDLFRSNPYFSADGNGDVEKFFELYIKNLDLTNGKGYI